MPLVVSIIIVPTYTWVYHIKNTFGFWMTHICRRTMIKNSISDLCTSFTPKVDIWVSAWIAFVWFLPDFDIHQSCKCRKTFTKYPRVTDQARTSRKTSINASLSLLISWAFIELFKPQLGWVVFKRSTKTKR